MKIYTLEQKQILPISLEKAWEFFANPQNLSKLTPDWMQLTIKGAVPQEMYEGMIMVQEVKPLFGIPLTWVTEITHIQEGSYFIDEQRMGPYKFWHHEHRLIETEAGVELIDTLHYAMPFGIIGRMVHALSVKKKVAEVFRYRYEVLEEMFFTHIE